MIKFLQSPFIWYMVFALLLIGVAVLATGCERLKHVGPF